VCRFLSPKHLLLGDTGELLLTYFCDWQRVDRRTDLEAIKQLYAAPEISGVSAEEVSPACDWWSVGALLFELAVGIPLHWCYPAGFTSHTILSFPQFSEASLSEEAQDLISQLLVYNRSERLGVGRNGVEELKSHPFFVGVDWLELEAWYNTFH